MSGGGITSVSPYSTTPIAGGIYSAPPTAYQPVRYTPGYNDYGQGIAPLFGRGYSRYFQPPSMQAYGPPGGTSSGIADLLSSMYTNGLYAANTSAPTSVPADAGSEYTAQE